MNTLGAHKHFLDSCFDALGESGAQFALKI